MPCSSSEGMGSGPSDSDFRDLKREVDTVTGFLCEIMSHMALPYSPEMVAWYEKHQKFDKEQGR